MPKEPEDLKTMPELERQALQRMFNQALTYVQEHQWGDDRVQAWGLVRDAVGYFMEDNWYKVHAVYPLDMISRKFLNYLKALPRKDRDTREWEAYRGERFRYSFKGGWQNSHELLRSRLAEARSAGPEYRSSVLPVAATS